MSRDDRRAEFVRLADYTIPEVRKALLAIAAFFIGFLPVVGSWSVYVPVAIYLRPRIAAAKAGMLNFYWMFLALITGVYTFGLVRVIIGPILIGVLKAVFESVVQPLPLAELSESS